MAPADSITGNANAVHDSENNIYVGRIRTSFKELGVHLTPEIVFPWSLGTSKATIAEQLGSAGWTNTYVIPNDTETSVSMTQVGLASPVRWVPDGNSSSIWSTSNGLPGDEVDPSSNGRREDWDIDPSAANFGFAAGFASGTKTNQMIDFKLDGDNTILANRWDMKTDMVVALCYQILEEVQTDVTLNWPNMTTSQINTLVPVESTARIIMSNETSTPTWFMNTTGQPVSAHWFGISLDQFLSGFVEELPSVNCLDTWFLTLQSSTREQPLSELLGQANQAKLVNASSQLYARYAVQAINANMRISGDQGQQDLPLYNGTLSIPVLRLKQNQAPKIVLQVLLGVMAVCGAIACSMLNAKELLRQSPCSIAGKMELLARSELCNSRKVIPEGAEW